MSQQGQGQVQFYELQVSTGLRERGIVIDVALFSGSLHQHGRVLSGSL